MRELCHPHNSGYPSSWFGEDGISWLLCDDHPGEPVFIPDRVSAERTEGVHYPPAAVLRFLSWLSAETDSVLSLYCVGYWGGDVDYAYSWVFEGRSGAGKVYIDAGDEVLVWDRRVPSDHPRELIQSGYVLLHTLDAPMPVPSTRRPRRLLVPLAATLAVAVIALVLVVRSDDRHARVVTRPANRVFVAQRLASQLGTLTDPATGQNAGRL